MGHLVLCLIAPLALTILQVSALITIPDGTTVQTPPKMIKQPPTDEQLFQVAEAKTNENDRPFVIECEAAGEPEPRYRWEKNGKRFEWQAYDNRISQQNGRGTLVITSPRDEDLGQYQCIAENEWGTAISNSVFVRKAELNSFKDEPPRTENANEGDPFKLTCQPPDGWPKPKVDWLIQYTSSGIKSINNSRMTLDPEGNLWFSNVTRNDASDDFYYTCAATSVFKKEYKLGDRILLNVLSSGASSSNNKHEPVKQYVSRKNEVALLGKRIEMYCIYGGTPLPQTVWNKDGRVLQASDRITQGNYGKSLIIKHVSFADGGTYTCDVSNGVGDAKSYSINLKVEAIPYFTHEPEIENKAEGETAIFRCEASGVPQPQIKWIHNGKPIEEAPPNPRRKVTDNMVIIEKLVKKDTGNYGCNATNSLGYVYKDVYVNVLAIPPQITQPPSNEATVDGKTIRITCRVFGAPKPEVKWVRNGIELTGGRYITLESGDLEIDNVNFLDAGSYTCYASNKFGHDNASGNLVVKEHTTITDEPEDYEVAAGSTATFRCNAVTDSSLSLTIDWLSNGEQIDFDMEPRFIRSTDYSLTITKTTELDSGTYTCVARTELDETKAQATLIVQDVPNAPRLEGVQCGKEEANVHWVPMGDNRAPILRYTIQSNTSFTPDTWEAAKDDVPATEQTYIVPMTPWANYTFRVLAWNKIGVSSPSSRSEVCTTQPDVPYKNPDNVEGRGTDPQNIVITWTVMAQIEHNAPKFMYRVFYKRDITGEEWTTEDVLDWKVHRLQVDNQPTYQRYKIKVVAINEKGECRQQPTEVIGYSGEDVPQQAPGNFTLLEVIGSTSASLSWNPVPEESIRGEFKGYKIQTWTDKDGEEGMREIHVKNDTTHTQFSKFVPYSKNYVRILAYNGRYNGPSSEILNFDTPEGLPGTVQSLDGFPLGSSALYLVWKKPERPNGILIGYKIYYHIVQGTNVGPLLERKPHVTNPEMTRVKLAGLEPSTKYRIHIRAITKAGEGEDYYIERTTGSALRSPPEEPHFTWDRIPTDNGLATIRVTWLPSRDGNPGSHFYVKYKLRGETIDARTPDEINSDSTEIRGLLRGEIYVMSVVAMDGDFWAESLPQEVDTSGEGPYIQPKENVATAGWFIGMMLAIAFLLLVLIIVCVIKRNRGGKYAVHERELAAGRGDYPEEGGGFHEYSQPLDTKSAGGRASLASSSHQDGKHPESDTDSMAEYGEGDTGRFTEDGSFIGQYGPKGRPEETPPIPTGTMATYV
ncbi:neuroglian isoform X1 [Neodiprion virginianus]|uniref:neuroglian isoform X1 n=1 Tax=Neodiprion virginianus TaxID=2961670 RepID=UPI001EE743CB|nr:neuroglian isoform X1 [Neodiprion virginianus]XP_046622377.1 neuroglian isoform X1 [Neodiprion virginianus]XP_046622387.1 neuroglian isoform X1 [Neodiprion virginianus]XP_046622397.1 neuroglian isoform X1 [Neodiprion virginianus]